MQERYGQRPGLFVHVLCGLSGVPSRVPGFSEPTSDAAAVALEGRSGAGGEGTSDSPDGSALPAFDASLPTHPRTLEKQRRRRERAHMDLFHVRLTMSLVLCSVF